MALTKATYSLIDSTNVNVLDFVPAAEKALIEAGTPSTDVSSYIQAAHDSLSVLGGNYQGTLYFPAGKYRVDSGLVLSPTVNVQGYGAILDFSNAGSSIIAVTSKSVSNPDIAALTNGGINGLQLYGPGRANTNTVGLFLGGVSSGDITHEKTFRDLVISEFGKGIEQDSNAYNCKFFGGFVYRNDINFKAGDIGDTNFAEIIELHGVTLAESVTASLYSRSNAMDIAVFGGSIDYDSAVAVDVAGDTVVSLYGTHIEAAVDKVSIDNPSASGNPTVNCFGCTFTRPTGSSTQPIVNADQIHFSTSGGWIRIGSGTQTTFVKSTGIYMLSVEQMSGVGTITNIANITGGTGFKKVYTESSASFNKPLNFTGGIGTQEVVSNYYGLLFSGLGTNMGVYVRTAAGTPPGSEAGIEQGSLLLNQADKKLYINTGTSSSTVWTVVGTQT